LKALVADGRGMAEVREVPDPELAPGQALVAVAATSLNRGELWRLGSAPDGWRPGWDFAGTVVQAAGEGPAAGARVVGIALDKAWAERVAVPAGWLAELPDGVSFEQAAALPTAGLTALRMLRFEPGTLGRRVLVTGAAGGVGRFALQLAHRGGAEVTAVVGRPERAQGLRELGATSVAIGLDALSGRYDLVLDAVGGDQFAKLAALLTAHGTLVIYGNSSGQPTIFQDIRDFYLGGLRRIQAFTIFTTLPINPPGTDLAYLARLVDDGELNPHVDSVLPWTQLGEALQRLAERSVAGKVVLRVAA
jgi:NADPH2:quinone reductase